MISLANSTSNCKPCARSGSNKFHVSTNQLVAARILDIVFRWELILVEIRKTTNQTGWVQVELFDDHERKHRGLVAPHELFTRETRNDFAHLLFYARRFKNCINRDTIKSLDLLFRCHREETEKLFWQSVDMGRKARQTVH